MHRKNVTSPVGPIALESDGTALTALRFGPGEEGESCSVLEEAARQLEEYFSGRRQVFDLPLAPTGTHFQQAVWSALLTIPYGETASYGQIAARIGRPKACRAVGMANNRNPISIFIPCHRVVGSDGSLVGYGGGLSRKEYLLRLESGSLQGCSFGDLLPSL